MAGKVTNSQLKPLFKRAYSILFLVSDFIYGYNLYRLYLCQRNIESAHAFSKFDQSDVILSGFATQFYIASGTRSDRSRNDIYMSH